MIIFYILTTKMPINRKRKIHQTFVKRAIKRRLLKISIRVDNYIYKNKPICPEEAENYIQEISVHKTECYNDLHILQVIEKLTRNMKSIIEATTKNKSLYKNVVASEDIQNIVSFPKSSINKTYKEKGDTEFSRTMEAEMTSACNTNEKYSTKGTIFNSESEEKNIGILSFYSEDVNELLPEGCSQTCNSNQKYTEHQSYNCNSHGTTAVNNVEVGIVGYRTTQNTITIKPPTYEPINKHIDKLMINEVRPTGHHTKATENVHSNLIPENCVKKRKYKKNITKTEAITQKTLIPLINMNTGKKKKINVATLNNRTAEKLRTISKKNKSRLPKKNADHDLPHTTNRRKKSIGEGTKSTAQITQEHTPPPSSHVPLNCATTSKYDHTDLVSDEVSLPTLRESNNKHRELITNQDLTKQMSALNIYKDSVVNDLSWIEDFRYVREITIEEYDRVPNRINDIFWNNFSFPDSWNDTDFLY